MAKKKGLSNKELGELFVEVDNEGFGYYMMHYGPDMDAIERLGFDKKEVARAIELMQEIESRINDGEKYADDF